MNLQKAPNFLLDLFRLRTTGQQPSAFGDTVIPVAVVDGMYGSAMQITSSVNGAVGALPRTQSIADIGESARYFGAAASIVVGAAAGTQMQATIFLQSPSQGSNVFPLFETKIWTPMIGKTYYFGGLFPAPLTLTDGAAIQAVVAGDAGGADHSISMYVYLEDPRRG